jgi:hypothetical protein
MRTERVELQVWRQNIRYSAIFAILTSVIACSLMLWSPVSGLYLTIAAASGLLLFFATLMEAHFRFPAVLVVLLLIPAHYEGRRMFVEPGFQTVSLLQFGCVAIAVWSSLVFVFRNYLLRHFERAYRAEPSASPNGGPAASVDNPNAPGGPPSVS